MVVTLIKPPPSYLDMPVLRLDNIALADETLATIAEAEGAIARLRSLTIDTARLELRTHDVGELQSGWISDSS